MKIMRRYITQVHRYIYIDLWSEKLQVNVELRLVDNTHKDFMRRYEHFMMWLDNMQDVDIDVDTIIVAFSKFKNAQLEGSESPCL